MSRLGKKPILIPVGVEIKIDGQKVIVKGPKGELSFNIPAEISLEIKEQKIFLSTSSSDRKVRACWGTARMIISNMIKGVVDGYEKKLEIEGVGYRAKVENENLVLEVGFSHPVQIDKVEGIKFLVEKNIITVSGIDKGLVGLLAAKIKKVRPPDPYKGKGIRYFGEVIKKKPGKKVVSTTG